MALIWLVAVTGLLLTSATSALTVSRPKPSIPKVREERLPQGPVADRNGSEIPPYNTTYYFEQLIDHNDPSKGTFTQRYWHTWEFYESGGPIILMTPGEVNAEDYYGYLTNETINGLIAEQQNGATIVIEHRFFGLSNPYDNLTSESLQLLTIQQAIDDLVYFAYNVDLPMPGGDAVTPDEAPWVLIGGSYSGALTGWVKVNVPDVFYAAYASSAVVESIIDYWGYFQPIREYMPANCSADVERVIAYVDATFTNGATEEIDALFTLFNMNLTHLDDWAGSLRYNLWDWQSLQPYSGPGQLFFEFCDALEVDDGVSADADGWGLEHALNAWGTYWADTYYPYICGDYDAETCLGTYDSTQSYYTDISVDNSDRSWEWIVCNYVGFLQDGAPRDEPTIVSRLIQPIYDERQCVYFFPDQFSSPPTPAAHWMNEEYAGWDIDSERLFFANGLRDPWREATVSADGLNKISTPWQPIEESDGFHCSDLLTESGEVDSTVAAVQAEGLAAMKAWLVDWTVPSS